MTEAAGFAATLALVAAFWADTLSLAGVIVSGLLGVATLIGILYGARWKSRWDQAQATIALYAQNAQGYENRAELAVAAGRDAASAFAAERDKLLGQLADDREEIGKLKALPSVAGLQDRLLAHDEHSQEYVGKLLEKADSLEQRAQERHEATLAVLQSISERLATRF